MLDKIVGYIPRGLKEKIPAYSYWHSLYFRIPSKHYLHYKHILEKLHDIHKGQRCFIIGTGPSLNKTNLSLLKDEIIFGVNTLYRGISEFGINCDYYAVSDDLVWKNHFKNILEIDTVLLLFSVVGKRYLSEINSLGEFLKNEPIVIKDLGPMWISKHFSKDLSTGAYWGGTVIIDICLQAAYYMGFNEVYLLGCDCDYSGLHRFDGLKTETRGGGAVGDWSSVFASYEICKRAYEEDGRKIINATVGGKLEVFERRKLEEVV